MLKVHVFTGSAFKSSCRFELNQKFGLSPQIIDQENVFSYHRDPKSKQWVYEANAGASFRVQCADSKERIANYEARELDVECVLGSVIRVTYKTLQIT